MTRKKYGEAELCVLAADITPSPKNFIREAYSRSVLNKILVENVLLYEPANFYRRLAAFAQYEPEAWRKIPQETRALMDEWYVREYIDRARPRLESALKDGELIENAFFFTLDETLELIDSMPFLPYVVPCNCKSVAMACEKPCEVCILFNRGINSEWDRGHGRELSKEEAKAVARRADKNGLMHTSEEMVAICHCCGDCCYPIRASKMLGTKGLWPKQRYRIMWHEEKCVSCGSCAAACNFGAFKRNGKQMMFEERECWGCTICAGSCPVQAISIEKIQK
ncbi:MAG: 4Fe-4S dicluster-binding protein [Cloacibacillus sp.]